MCGRYYIPEPDADAGFKEILEHVKKVYGNQPTYDGMKRGEIFPTDIVPVVTENAPALMKWGYPRFDGKRQVINARLETAGEKTMLKKSNASPRCHLPAGHYYE
jgi:putative SOS response-associated peptidase YedK